MVLLSTGAMSQLILMKCQFQRARGSCVGLKVTVYCGADATIGKLLESVLDLLKD